VADNETISRVSDTSFQSTTHTGTRDITYDLVSVLYHALQGAENYAIYAADAEQEGDSELQRFFEEVREEEVRRAARAKQLLKQRIR
jgi:hypothetical protein